LGILFSLSKISKCFSSLSLCSLCNQILLHGNFLYCRYVSSDFGNHPLSHLMGSVFGMHNRKNVEVFNLVLFNLFIFQIFFLLFSLYWQFIHVGILLCLESKWWYRMETTYPIWSRALCGCIFHDIRYDSKIDQRG
jgi:hypothetical protein